LKASLQFYEERAKSFLKKSSTIFLEIFGQETPGRKRKGEESGKGKSGKNRERVSEAQTNRKKPGVYGSRGRDRHSVKTENRNASMNTKVENIMGGEKGEHLITKRELACRLKRTVRTITNWQRRGIIPYVRWRHAVYFDWQAVRASLQPRQGLLDFAPAHGSPGLTEREMPPSKGPVRLPVYQMREERKAKSSRRGLTSAATKLEAESHGHTSVATRWKGECRGVRSAATK
jgi:hypothetical protein